MRTLTYALLVAGVPFTLVFGGGAGVTSYVLGVLLTIAAIRSAFVPAVRASNDNSTDPYVRRLS